MPLERKNWLPALQCLKHPVKKMKTLIKLFCILLTALCLISCNEQKTDVSSNAFKLKEVELAQIADKINSDFVAVRKQVELFASFTKMIYENRENLKQGLKNSKYELYQDICL